MSEEDFRVHFPEKKGLFSFHTLKLLLKIGFALMMVALIGTVVIRSCVVRGSKEMRAYLWTSEAIAVSENEDFKIWRIPEMDQPSVNRTFQVSSIYYTEPIGQLQFLLSYNDSKLKAWAEELELDEVPKSGEDIFVFVLIDSEGNRYTEYEYVTDHVLTNGFFRLVFDGVSMNTRVQTGVKDVGEGEEEVTEPIYSTVPIEKLVLCVYYKNSVDFEGIRLDEMTIYENGFYKEGITLSVPEEEKEGVKSQSVTESPWALGAPQTEDEESMPSTDAKEE